jgi:hypothetical protein
MPNCLVGKKNLMGFKQTVLISVSLFPNGSFQSNSRLLVSINQSINQSINVIQGCDYVCFKNHTKHTSTLCGQNVDFLMLNLAAHKVTVAVRISVSYRNTGYKETACKVGTRFI